jgi:tripartite-type tricarboxylate transporter receptor subunit TctC
VNIPPSPRKFSARHGAEIAWLAVSCCLAAVARAQPAVEAPPPGYPNRPIRVIVGSAPGGGADIIARAVSQHLAARWNRSVVVDNRGGGGGVIALELLAQAAPDGYTLFGGASLIVTATPMKKVKFDTRKALVPVVQLTTSPYLLLAPPALPAHTVQELIGYAKSRPNALSYGSAGIGSVAHLGTELFNYMAGGLDMVHVPYKGYGQALTDLMGGQIQLLFTSGLSGTPFVKSGKLKALAVTSLRRLHAFPEVPTVAESGVAYFQLENMHGLYAPVGVPSAIVEALNTEAQRFMNSVEMKARLAAEGTEAAPPNTPAEFRRTFVSQVDLWERFITRSGIKLND